MSERLSKEIIQEINDAWLNINVSNDELIRPLDLLNTVEPERYYLALAYLMSQPEYFSFLCKAILGIDILPFQGLMLGECWNRKFPMVIGSRGMGKSFILALYCILRALLLPNRKIVVVGAAFRQSKILYEYMENIWKNAPILRDMCDSNSRPSKDPDECRMILNGSSIIAIPIGDGQKIRGKRANDIVADEFSSQSKPIFETVIAGFAAVSASPAINVRSAAAKRRAKELNVSIEELGIIPEESMGNQIIISGTAYYDFNHFADYYRRWKMIINSRGDPHKLQELFGEEPIPESFNWKDYAIFRVPVELIPKGFMDESQIARSRATIHTGIYQMEYGACGIYDTAIITDRGIKKLGEITIGDYVLTHKGRFKKVTNKTFKFHKGELIEIDPFGNFEKICFTHEHPFWVNDNEFIEIRELDKLYTSNLKELSNIEEIDCRSIATDYVERNDFIYPRSSQNKISETNRKDILSELKIGRSVKDIASRFNLTYGAVLSIKKDNRKPKNSIPSKIDLSYNFGLCIGYYASEGSCGANDKAVSFALDGHVDNKLEYFVTELSSAILSSLKINPKIYYKKQVANVTVNSKILCEIIKYICPGNCYTKLINHEILFSNKEFLKGFVVGIWNGDGHKRHDFGCITLSNQNLIYQIKLALSYFGINSSFLKIRDYKNSIMKGKNVKLKPAWKLTISGREYRKFLNIFYNQDISLSDNIDKVYNDNKCINEIRNKKLVDFSGLVYNLEVEDDHSYSTTCGTVHNCFAKDSQGFFKRSLIESCVGTDDKPISLMSGQVCFDPILKGNTNLRYVMGIDPASEIDNFSIVIIELRGDHRRIVYNWSTNKKEHVEKIKAGVTTENNFYSYCGRKIRDLMNLFPIARICIDSQGGGVAIREVLHDEVQLKAGELPIWEIIDPEKEKESDDKAGLHILEMCNFANYDWLSNANHGLRKDFEDKILIFPKFDPITISISIEEDKVSNRLYDTLEDCILEIEELKKELSMIEITKTNNGRDRWDTPEVKLTANKKTRLRKDRYSALLMANAGAKAVMTQAVQAPYIGYGGFAELVRDKPKSVEYTGPEWFTSAVKGVY